MSLSLAWLSTYPGPCRCIPIFPARCVATCPVYRESADKTDVGVSDTLSSLYTEVLTTTEVLTEGDPDRSVDFISDRR